MDEVMTLRQISDAECLDFVERSPAAVAAHDRTAWIGLFARYSLVEDPVGSAPQVTGIYDARTGYRSAARLRRFYETFIAANTICFHVDRDIVSGLHVVRDLTIEITMSAQVVVRVPVHLLYELTQEHGELKIFRLAAHWELWPMLKQQMASGRDFARVGSASAARMLRYLGLGGMLGFMRALSSVGAAGKAQAEQFRHCFNAADRAGLERLFASPQTTVSFPHAGPGLSIAECAAQAGELRFSKVLAAGNVVSVTVEYHTADGISNGVGFFELHRRSLRIVSLTVYLVSG